MENIKYYGLTNPQKSIYYTKQLYKGTSIANMSGTIFIEKIVDFDALRKAINLLIKENSALRTKIIMKDNIPVQYYSDYIEYNIELINFENKNDLDLFINKEIRKPFSEENEYLFKAIMFRFPNGKGGYNIINDHLTCDAWSAALMCNQIMKNYEKILNKEKADLKNEFSYEKYIEEEKEYLKSEKFKKDKLFWEEKYSKLTELVSTNKNRNEKINCNANRIEYELSENDSRKISEYCEKNKISIYAFLLTIYSIYFSRITGIEEVTIGTPVLNRKNIIEKNTLGMFINTIPITLNFTENKNMIDIFNSTGKEILSVFRHQRYPYIELLKYIREKHRVNRGLYDIIISYQNARTTSSESKIPYHTKWDFNGNISETLNIHITDMDDTSKFKIFYDYQIEKHNKEDICYMHNRIMFIIKQVLNNKKLLLDSIDIVPKEEKEIIKKLNINDVKYPKNKNICDIFEEQAKNTPNNIAVSINNEKITYAELNKKANKLAYTLIKKGIKKDVPVGIRINKSIEMIIGILAIIKSGGCYLPIDLAYPKERIDFMIKDSNAKILLTNKHSNNLNLKIETLEIDNNEIYSENEKNLNLKIKSEDLLYIIYTSGSTGTPKGTMITHRNVVRLLKNDKFLFDFNSKDVWTMFHSVAFDFSVWEMYGALLNGARLVLVPENIAKSPKLFLNLLREENVTILNQTPTYFYNLLDYEMKLEDSSLKLKYIIFGGEELKPNLIKKWKEKYRKTKLINMYGITETTVHVTYKELKEKDLEISSSNIGKPIPTLQIYILDNKQRMLPIGIEGEICVSGDGICKGYLNRNELNKEKFIDNPYKKETILYRSADSAILNEDGNLYYKGRIDKQVKIRGFRVELGEIETKLIRHPAIEKCVVIEDKLSEKDSHLVAYIVCNSNVKIEALKLYLKDLVPNYMIPNYFVKVKEIPLTSNGKIDKNYLKTLNYTIEKETEYAEPRNKFEIILKNIIEKEMNINKIGIDDDIIELGADSLTLMRITAELLENNYEVSIQKFYEQKTIREISDTLKVEKSSIEKVNKELFFEFNENVSRDKIKINNILLTGATGFLGIHILNDLIKYTKSTVFCLIRNKNKEDGLSRLKKKIKYYFDKEEKIYKELGKRIIVIDGDISKEKLGLSDEEYKKLGYKIDTVIHSAAIVNHYGKKEIFEAINVNGIINIINFCKQFSIKLNHISTTSVSANFTSNNRSLKDFNEHCLYIGQPYQDNIYVKTKFEAEYNIWKEADNGLEYAIYRLGNITSRYSDGKFQENDYQNAFLNRMLALIKLGVATERILNYEFDMSPVDICSKFIIEIMQHQTSYNKVFHIVNNNKINLKLVLDALEIKNVKILNEKEFIEYVKNSKEKIGLINDITNKTELASKIIIDSGFTIEYLKNLDLMWKKIDKNYIKNYVKKYISLGEQK